MNETTQTQRPSLLGRFFRWLFRRQTQGRALIGLAALGTLAAIFYLEEDWRGWHAWQSCKCDLEAKGVVLDWEKLIPPPVPDGQNFFKAPKMAEWFVGRGESDLSKRLQSQNGDLTSSAGAATNLIATPEIATRYLAWSDQFKPDFDLMREALKRPYARMDGDYSRPYEAPIPIFLAVRNLAQVLAQRAHCYFLLNEPEKALDELTLLNDLRRLLEGAPTGKPMTLVAAMMNVAVTGLYMLTIDDGFQRRVWQEPQLVALQKQLERINLPSIVVQAFDSEPAATTHTLETAPTTKLADWFSSRPKNMKWALWPLVKSALIPRGWIYQNMATDAKLAYQQTEGVDPTDNTIRPKRFGDVNRELHSIAKPYKFIAAWALPNFTKAWQATAHNQAMVNEAQIACALERYRLEQGAYPGALDALVPQFIEKLPHDIIGGKPLIYRRTADGTYLLYSIGWNETDDGGQDASATSPNDFTQGDCVWKN